MNTAILDRKQWLADRLKSVGASESAAAIGVNPFKDPITLWQEKTGRASGSEENEAMLWGQILEPVVITEYERRTGETVERRQDFVRHPILPFMTATLDGMTPAGKLVEVKTASAFSRGFGDEDADELPDHYRVQVHSQMACTGATEADLVVLIGGQRLKVYPVARDAGLVNAIEDRVGEFWRCVETDTPPTWGRMTPQALAVINPGCEGEAEWGLAVAEMVASTLDRIDTEKAEIKAIEEWMETAKSVVLGALGGAQFGTLPDGRKVKRFLKTTPARSAVVNYKASTSHYFKVLKGNS